LQLNAIGAVLKFPNINMCSALLHLLPAQDLLVVLIPKIKTTDVEVEWSVLFKDQRSQAVTKVMISSRHFTKVAVFVVCG
jgi:hypothetical protein